MDEELNEILNIIYAEHFIPYLDSDLELKEAQLQNDRFYITHTDSNVIALFPPIDQE